MYLTHTALSTHHTNNMTKTNAAKKRAKKAAAERRRQKKITAEQKDKKNTRDRELKRRTREADKAEWNDWVNVENKDELPEVLDITELEVLPPNHPTPQASELCQIRT